MFNQNDDDGLSSFSPSSDTKVRGQNDRDTYQSDSSSDRPTPPWSEGDSLGPFDLERLLGRGSSGYVYRALNRDTQKRCALKLLLPTKTEDLVRNKLGFRRMIALRHPALMHIDRIHHLKNYTAFSMEEIHGVTFAGWCKKNATNPATKNVYADLLSLTRQYASALAMMHAHGLVHRDIKPLNLMVDEKGNGRVIDYGLVGTIDVDSDPRGHRDYLVGPRHYFAPETLWDQFYLPASDIFSLGLLVLETLRIIAQNSKPYDSPIIRSQEDRSDDQHMIHEAFSELSSDVPTILREACEEMLQQDPGDRPSAAEITRLGSSEAPSFLWIETPIVGREEELIAGQQWIDKIFDGNVGRLHVEGPPGIGKSRLLDELENYVKGKRWGQVFRAKCRRGEDHPLQAFDQICDAIATRYMKSDREKMEVDPVSAEILHRVFPVLHNAVRASMSADPARKVSERLDALEAGARLSEELRIVGPLVLIIDDSQWADRDSLNVLDRLQSVSGGMLGIITASHVAGDRQISPPTATLSLNAISETAARALLVNASRRYHATINESLVQELIQAASGNPFRLIDFSEEFRVGGVLHQRSDSDAGKIEPNEPITITSIDQVWRMRMNRLSEEAKTVLAYIATADRQVSMYQLSQLTKLGENVDVAVSELSQQRLIRDEATGAECISIIHDRMGDGLLEAFSEEERRQCHSDWGNYLSRQNGSDQFAARIAGHFFAAEEPSRAVSYAIMAAEDAERYVAKTEAARWHARVIPFLSGEERIERIRQAAMTFAEADRPTEAAEYYQMLASEVDADESIEHQLVATALLIRSGRFPAAQDQLRSLARLVGAPLSKPDWLGKLNLLRLWIQLSVCKTLRRKQTKAKAGSLRERQRLQLCLAIARPLSAFDNLYAAELNSRGAIDALRYGTESQRILAEIGETVFGCYDRGMVRVRSEIALQELLSRANALGSSKTIGDVWAGVTFSHVFSMRWQRVGAALETCLQHYRAPSDPLSFEILHTRWFQPWALWHTGRWHQMVEASSEMQDDAKQRNDLLEWLMVSGAMGASAWLVRDQASECSRIRDENAKSLQSNPNVQAFDFTEWIAKIHLKLYQGDFESGWDEFKILAPQLKKLPFSRFQLWRVLTASLGALLCLHLLKTTSDEKWSKLAKKHIEQLKREQNAFADTLSLLYGGLLLTMTQPDQASRNQTESLFVEAIALAKAQHLRPYQLAAEDALSVLQTGQSQGSLIERMHRHGVKRPSRFARLYTVE
ncbi:Serine/threonine-protein kinase PrkC [Planctomycetes bacterium CA13]|uniref:Serine/threonine-protein kinase PrkC n=1 Tax=Novipirellula herctigrandis TaxID=2527986 RepID=A0A5C5YXQ7_9BACT|nr:Serine/threonine-protein kinase PrkC [Planctomycetes bacterium CA13]